MEEAIPQVASIISSVHTWIQFATFLVIVALGVWYIDRKDKINKCATDLETQKRVDKRDAQMEGFELRLTEYTKIVETLNTTLQHLEITVNKLDKTVSILEDRNERPYTNRITARQLHSHETEDFGSCET